TLPPIQPPVVAERPFSNACESSPGSPSPQGIRGRAPMPSTTKAVVGVEAERLFARARAKSPGMNLAMEDSEHLFISKRMKRVGVMLVHVSEPKSLRAVRLAIQDQSTADGDVFVTTWNDGNNATWEGNLYYIDYDSGAEYSNDIQLDVSNPWRPP